MGRGRSDGYWRLPVGGCVAGRRRVGGRAGARGGLGLTPWLGGRPSGGAVQFMPSIRPCPNISTGTSAILQAKYTGFHEAITNVQINC
ncbi:hypothetical protein E2C01_003337 [Portunus trituberculatus]|uniref:Uncharacterized protein n=1 Tax=Portunus trituberculatus TaxID=210409 RepID=A0A5B7CM49_PORTR|nr:hypothetical protein [Portunus trituberculatus]